jgi:flagellar basal body-associated protein FliL
MTEIIFLIIGAIIIIALGIYAGKMLFMLKQQKLRQQNARNKRVESMVQSIQTIAFAMQQQQCNYSEGAIRICSLLRALPIKNIPDYALTFPHLHSLFDKVKDFPTHEERNALSKQERRQQDKLREQFESEAESKIQEEIERLKKFTC